MCGLDSGEDSCMVFWLDSMYKFSKEYTASFFRVELPSTASDHNLTVHNIKFLCQTVIKNLYRAGW